MNGQHNYTGLNDQEVKANREKYGSNILTPPKRESLLKLFLEKFKDPIIIILLVAAALSLVISIMHNEYAETIGILCAIFLATGVGFWFEMDANRKFDLLNKINDDINFKVLRNGHITEVSKQDIVVGDIVILETGDEIPADGELLEAISLQVNESTLTGEPSIDKTTQEADFDAESTYPSNHIFRGTTVINGHCTYQVTQVGDATEFGKVAEKATEKNMDKTPLTKQLDGLAKFISIVGFIVAGLIFVTLLVRDILSGVVSMDNLLTLDTAGLILQYFMIAVTLIVVSVPEGLPMSVTLSLALSMRKMLKTNNLVRKMHACETMGATTVICTDKTGTLTQNKMQVSNCVLYPLDEQNCLDDSDAAMMIAEGIAINSTAFLEHKEDGTTTTLGNPTESALLLWLHSQNMDYNRFRNDLPILEQLPFSTEHKYMASMINSSVTKERIVYVKGAPEIILSRCSTLLEAQGKEPLKTKQSAIEKQLLDYQNMAMRTLAIAYYKVEPNEDPNLKELHDLTLLGIFAIADPIRPDVPTSVKECLKAGIQVKIVTGDTYATAQEIGRQIGIITGNESSYAIITGTDFEKLTDEAVLAHIKELKIMCRARPTDKQRLVQLLKQSGEVVAVTGDGTNDAPALNHADVGLSMGSGTSVAKEASDITLLDDSFSSIETAVMWGRSLYHNIQRFILFQLTINLTAMLIVLIGSIFGKELPLTVTQMLWVNMIIDTFAAAALASLPPNKNVMKEMPRKNNSFIITPLMKRHILFIGSLFATFLIGLMYWFTNAEGTISTYNLSIFFTIFVMLQFWNLFNAKAFMSGSSAFKDFLQAKGFITVLFIIPIGQFLIVEFGGEVFRTVPILFQDWIYIIAGTSLVMWFGELIRLIQRKKA